MRKNIQNLISEPASGRVFVRLRVNVDLATFHHGFYLVFNHVRDSMCLLDGYSLMNMNVEFHKSFGAGFSDFQIMVMTDFANRLQYLVDPGIGIVGGTVEQDVDSLFPKLVANPNDNAGNDERGDTVCRKNAKRRKDQTQQNDSRTPDVR